MHMQYTIQDCFASEVFDPNRCSYWYLTGGREVGGFTTLEFRRQLDFLHFVGILLLGLSIQSILAYTVSVASVDMSETS